MRINPIGQNIYNNNRMQKQSFKGVNSFDEEAVKEVLGNKLAFYDKASDEKSINIWLFKKTKGGMAKMEDGYIAMIQNKDDSSIIKEIHCGPGEEAIKKFRRRLEDSLVWVNATSNMSAMVNLLQDSQTLAHNTKFAHKVLTKMREAGSQNQMTSWSEHLKNV